jgi:hypothetical protein
MEPARASCSSVRRLGPAGSATSWGRCGFGTASSSRSASLASLGGISATNGEREGQEADWAPIQRRQRASRKGGSMPGAGVQAGSGASAAAAAIRCGRSPSQQPPRAAPRPPSLRRHVHGGGLLLAAPARRARYRRVRPRIQQAVHDGAGGKLLHGPAGRGRGGGGGAPVGGGGTGW